MGQSYNRRMPADFLTVSNSKKWSGYYRGFAMFAPLWADTNFLDGQVTYHIYDRTDTKVTGTEKYRVKHALQLAREDTVNYGGSSSINPSWVMVISWVDNTPRMYYSEYFEQVSLGLIARHACTIVTALNRQTSSFGNHSNIHLVLLNVHGYQQLIMPLLISKLFLKIIYTREHSA